ncbi:MAG TPA: hypothetical protein VKM55_05580 [Candidatus Lokiarchaeia archaeon]|nr:hypothetical protein [Candidatus Lokiarchaeia archaeon]
MVDLVDQDTYYLQTHATEFQKYDGNDFRTVYILNSVAPKLPSPLLIDASGWGPYKSLVLRH